MAAVNTILRNGRGVIEQCRKPEEIQDTTHYLVIIMRGTFDKKKR